MFEYKLIHKVTDIVNGLLIKWKLTHMDHYLYRTSGRACHVKILNMNTLNSSFITRETLWYSVKVS